MSAGPDEPPARVHATAWGDDRAHEMAAIDDLRGAQWPGAHRFDWRSFHFEETGPPRPLDMTHPSVLASNAGPGWAWVLHDPLVPAPLLELGRRPRADGGEGR